MKRILRWMVRRAKTFSRRPVVVHVATLPSREVLKGKRIVITGGGRGLGFAFAKKCVAEGALVVVSGRSEEALGSAVRELGEDRCFPLVYDVTKTEGASAFLQECARLLGGTPDALVCNAGISLHEGGIRKVTHQGWDAQMETNLKAPYFLAQQFIAMIEGVGAGKGNILFVSSERGLYCDDMPYGIGKAALNSFTRGLARRVLSSGIRVNGIAPGVTVSDMTGYTPEGNLDRPQACGGRVFLPEEVAEVAAFLLSDASACISGEVIACDQGNYLRCDW